MSSRTNHFDAWHLYSPKLVTELIDKGEEMLAMHYPQADFVSIGQSPAWLCRTANLLARAQQNHSRFCYVPFSKSFGKSETVAENGEIIADFKIERPQHLREYRRRLQKRELCPSQTIHSFKTNQRPTIFVDYVRSGRGLGSFMHMMYNWAAEGGPEQLADFMVATRVHVLKDKDTRGIEVMRFADLGVTVKPSVQRVSDNFLHYFADSPDDHPDRLVGFYPDSKWHHGSPDKNDIGLLGEIGAHLAREVTKRTGCSTRKQPLRQLPRDFGGFLPAPAP